MTRHQLLGSLLCLVLGAGLAAGCGSEPTSGGLPPDGVGVTVAALQSDTSVAFFAMGRSHDFQPFGGEGTITPGPPPSAQMTFRGAAEGDSVVDFAGYASRAFAAPNPAGFPSSAWCVRDLGQDVVSIVSGFPEWVSIAALATTTECERTGFSRYTADATYAGDPLHPWFGSAGGENIVSVYFDDWGAHAPIEVRVDTGGVLAPFGLFASLPDVGDGEVWPDPAAWNADRLTLTADANGDAQCYLVVRPGARSVLWETIATQTVLDQSARIVVWVAGEGAGPAPGCVPADCNDDNPCTSDRCDADAGCVHSAVPNGSPCGTQGICHEGGCIEPVRIEAIGNLTGWASTNGTANSAHSELRCGDDGLLATGFESGLFPGLSFDLSALPPGATVASARLRVYLERIRGDRPFLDPMREVVAEHVRFSSIFFADEVPPIAGTIGQRLVADTPDLGWRSVDITEAVAYEQSRARVQVRFSFMPEQTEPDGQPDMAVFASDNNLVVEHRPYLLVYLAP